MKRRVSDIAVMILSFLVLLALSAETALVGVEAVRGEQWQLTRLTAWLQGSGVWGGIACIAVAVLALVLLPAQATRMRDEHEIQVEDANIVPAHSGD